MGGKHGRRRNEGHGHVCETKGTIMYRVLLVDDEAIARTGLRSTFDWEKYGYRLVGEASNGQRAMKWIVNGDLDILITDIAMPVMDGLELTRRTKELCPWVKVLLLSCHSDFEFVREGIRLGASDYILADAGRGLLGAVLDHMRLKLEEEKQMQRILTEHEQQQRLNKKKAAGKMLFQALSGEPEALAKLEAWNHNGPYLLAVLQLDSDLALLRPAYSERIGMRRSNGSWGSYMTRRRRRWQLGWKTGGLHVKGCLDADPEHDGAI